MQQSSQVLNDPVVGYLEGFCSQSSHHFTSGELENRDDEDLVWNPSSFSYLERVSLKNLCEYLQPYHDSYQLKLHESKDAYEILYSWNVDNIE